MKKMILVITALILMFVIVSNVRAESYTIKGDTVYVNLSGKGMISQTPHTLRDTRNYPVLNFTNYFGQDLCLDVAFGFDTEKAKPKSAELWKQNVSHQRIVYDYGMVKVHRDCAGVYQVNYGLDGDIAWCNDSQCLQDTPTAPWCYWEVEYDSYATNASGARVWYFENQSIGWHYEYDYYDDWVDVTDQFSSEDALGKRWYYVQNVNFVDGETKTLKPRIDVDISQGNTAGKYDLIMKRCEDTIQEAFVSGNYVFLDPWWNTSWVYRRNITITKPSDSILTNFTVLIPINYTSQTPSAQADCDDYRFTDNSSTALDHEVENCSIDPSVLSYVWVRIPDAWDDPEYIVTLYYNNTAVSSGDSTDTWDTDYVGVWHMTLPADLDSTSHGHDGTIQNSVTHIDDGQIDGANDFDKGNADKISFTDIDEMDSASQLTMEIWGRVDTAGDYDGIFDKSSSNAEETGFILSGEGLGGNDDIFVSFRDGSVSMYAYTENNIVSVGTWYHMVYVFNGSTTGDSERMKYYHDGAVQSLTFGASVGTTTGSTATPLVVGSLDFASLYISGDFDEARVSKIARDKNYINATYQITNNPTNYVAFSSQETQEAAPESDPPVISGLVPLNNTEHELSTPFRINFTITDDDDNTIDWKVINITDPIEYEWCSGSSANNTFIQCNLTLQEGDKVEYEVQVSATGGTTSNGTNYFNISSGVTPTTYSLGIDWYSPTADTNHTNSSNKEYQVEVFCDTNDGSDCKVNVSIDPSVQLVDDEGLIDDAYISSENPNTNYGSEQFLYFLNEEDSGDDRYNSVVKLNLSSIPSGSIIDEAILALWLDVNNLDNSLEGWNLTVYRIPSTWNESGITWNNKPAHNTTVVDRLHIDGTTPTQMYYTWNVTEITNELFQDGYTNISFIINVTDTYGSPAPFDLNDFDSKEATNETKEPYVNITYTEVAEEETRLDKGGLIPACPNSPFCTDSTNPITINISDESSAIINWTVNATGTEGSTYNFNASIELFDDASTNNVTYNLNITINGTAPSEPPADTCTYTSGVWNVDCSDYCEITADTNTLPYMIDFTGTGEFRINAEVTTNFTTLATRPSTCKIVVETGDNGRFVMKP